MSLKAIIVDDEQHARENLRLMVDEFCPEVQLVGSAGGVEPALELIAEVKPDLVFLDIRMPAGNEGFQLLEQVDNPSFQVIFVTAFKDYALQGFKLNGILFLLKPLHIGDLRDAMETLVKRQAILDQHPESRAVYLQSLHNLTRYFIHHEPARMLTLVLPDRFQALPIASIRYVESKGKGVAFYTGSDEVIEDAHNLRNYEDILDRSAFFRISRKHLVNLRYASQLRDRSNQPELTMDTGQTLEVASTRLEDLRKALKQVRN